MRLRTAFVSVLFLLSAACSGVDGDDGENGVDGLDGTNGVDGADGSEGADGVDGDDGVNGADGADGSDGVDGAQGPEGTVVPAEYVGLDTCAACHPDHGTAVKASGHMYKIIKVEGGVAPDYPYSEVPNPPEGYTWDQISYVIGGYGWKARFMDLEGYIITGDADATTQYNLATQEWVAYHAGEEKPYNCGSCHTTGYEPTGHQDDLPGITGTWAEAGISCERCHGAGSLHAGSPYEYEMKIDRDKKACGECHRRSDLGMIDASGGFEKHHEQVEEMVVSRKAPMNCVDCHNPHRTAKFDDNVDNPDMGKGISTKCEKCHWRQDVAMGAAGAHATLECTQCHMPKLGKSAVGNVATFTGDIASHLFAINPDGAADQFTVTDPGTENEKTWVNSYITLDYACRHCHIEGGGMDKSDAELEAVATGFHGAI